MDCYSNVKNALQKSKFQKVFVSIILGQKSQKCRRFGICKMKPIQEEGELLNSDFDCLAYLSQNTNGHLNLQFLLEWMTEQTYQKHFASGIFIIGEDFVIPGAISQQLQVQKSLVIRAGSYPIKGDTLFFNTLQGIAA